MVGYLHRKWLDDRDPCCILGYMKQPTHLRLKPEEEERIEQAREALSRKMGGAPITKSHTMHVMLAKGYEALAKELGFKVRGQP